MVSSIRYRNLLHYKLGDQELADELYAKTKAPIDLIASDGTRTPYESAEVLTAIHAATSGDIVLLGPGTHTTTAAITVPTGVTVRGVGKNVSVIQMAGVNGTVLTVAASTTAYLEGFHVENTNNGTASRGIACPGTLYASDIQTTAAFDGINLSSGTLFLRDWIHTSTGSQAARAMNVTTGLAIVSNFDFTMSATGTQHAVNLPGAGRIQLTDGRIFMDGASASNIAARNTTTAGSITLNNVFINVTAGSTTQRGLHANIASAHIAMHGGAIVITTASGSTGTGAEGELGYVFLSGVDVDVTGGGTNVSLAGGTAVSDTTGCQQVGGSMNPAVVATNADNADFTVQA